MSELFVVKTGLEDRPVIGFDSMIVTAPPGIYVEIDGKKALHAARLSKTLTALSHLGAEEVGERLRHAVWVISVDPKEIRTRGLMHNCAACRAGVDQAMAALRENPDREIMVGALYWAG